MGRGEEEEGVYKAEARAHAVVGLVGVAAGSARDGDAWENASGRGRQRAASSDGELLGASYTWRPPDAGIWIGLPPLVTCMLPDGCAPRRAGWAGGAANHFISASLCSCCARRRRCSLLGWWVACPVGEGPYLIDCSTSCFACSSFHHNGHILGAKLLNNYRQTAVLY